MTRTRSLGLIYLSPYILGLMAFTAIPFLASFYLSFTDYNLMQPPKWTGLENYIELFTSDRTFRRSLSVTLLYVFQHTGIMFVAETAFLGDLPPNWFFGIEPNAFGAVGAVVNFGVAYLVASMTKAPPEDVQELVESIRVPIGAGKAVDH